mmetsp:Transcript_161738/g.298417  ORF Transcript_161738/g.298417 Transcript_161738/m.298417 type:complete len:487 (+) Transcript_161738:267-1727(+)
MHRLLSPSPLRPPSGLGQDLRPNSPVHSSIPPSAHQSEMTPPAQCRTPAASSPASARRSLDTPPGYCRSSLSKSPAPAHRNLATPSGQCWSSQLRPLAPDRIKSAERAVPSSPRSLFRGVPDRDDCRGVGSPSLTSRHLKSRSPKPRKLSTCETKDTAKGETCNIRWLQDVLQPQSKSTAAVHDRLALRSLSSMDGHNHVAHQDIEFVELLGTGSFGAVWRGNYKGQAVAVKQCVVGDIKDTNMLLEEIRCLQALRHPRLVSYLGCCNKRPHVLMLMEYMSGGSLNDFLFKKKTSLKFNDRARMAYEVADGLTYIHGLCVVHRDLKTANVVLDDQLHCKICDFGLTLMLEQSHVTVQKLEGSPRYMAPEQFQTKARITEKCDVWQFGCIMLELFCLVVPFSQCTGIQQIAAELLVRKRPPSVPIEADQRARVLVQAGLRISPSARPTAAALKRALCGAWKDRVETEAEDSEECSCKTPPLFNVHLC